MKELRRADVLLALVEGTAGLGHVQLEAGRPLLHALAVATLEAEDALEELDRLLHRLGPLSRYDGVHDL